MFFKAADTLVWTRSLSCTGGNCVQVASVAGMVAIRDSKDPGGPILTYSAQEWTAFTEGVKNGDFNDIIK
jgi:Domain of unknown function (DUF397)